jgi:hypothetical protein
MPLTTTPLGPSVPLKPPCATLTPAWADTPERWQRAAGKAIYCPIAPAGAIT